MRYAALILILLAMVADAEETASGDSYLCVPDKSTGFVFNKSTKLWDQTNFRLNDKKYLIKPTTEDEPEVYGNRHPNRFAYGVWELGADRPTSNCEEGITNAGWLICRIGKGEFKFNSISNRFMSVFSGSYLTSTFDISWDKDDALIIERTDDQGGDTPYMIIGKCSKL